MASKVKWHDPKEKLPMSGDQVTIKATWSPNPLTNSNYFIVHYRPCDKHQDPLSDIYCSPCTFPWEGVGSLRFNRLSVESWINPDEVE